MLLELQKGIIYGPIRSRRLGWSLGINVLPGDGNFVPQNTHDWIERLKKITPTSVQIYR